MALLGDRPEERDHTEAGLGTRLPTGKACAQPSSLAQDWDFIKRELSE